MQKGYMQVLGVDISMRRIPLSATRGAVPVQQKKKKVLSSRMRWDWRRARKRTRCTAAWSAGPVDVCVCISIMPVEYLRRGGGRRGHVFVPDAVADAVAPAASNSRGAACITASSHQLLLCTRLHWGLESTWLWAGACILPTQTPTTTTTTLCFLFRVVRVCMHCRPSCRIIPEAQAHKAGGPPILHRLSIASLPPPPPP